MRYTNINKWWEFSPEYCSNLDEKDKSQLKPLQTEYCQKLWKQYVSEKHQHLMKIKSDDDWNIYQKELQPYNWEKDWENDKYNAFFENVMPLVSWGESDMVYFFQNSTCGIEAPWKLICKYWMSFLYEDEASIIINPKSETAILLIVGGHIELRKRKRFYGEYQPLIEIKNIYELINLIRPRLGMYIGENTITAMRSFLFGYGFALEVHKIKRESEEPDFALFHDFVANKYNEESSTAGWCNLILKHNENDQKKSLEVFFNLVEEFRQTIN